MATEFMAAYGGYVFGGLVGVAALFVLYRLFTR